MTDTSRITVEHGDSREVLKGFPDNHFDSVVTDPPYALTSTTKRWSNSERTDGTMPKVPVYARATAGFMGQKWDNGETAFDAAFWAEVMRVLKPGGHVVAFSGTRTYHRMACAIEDGGFEIRDQLAWAYGSGFPKSHDVSKAIDKATGAKGTYGAPKSAAHAGWIERGAMRGGEGHEGYQRPWMEDGEAVDRAARQYEPASDSAKQWEGWGTALKPAWETICLAQKPSTFWDLYATIGSQISALESCLWSMLPANIAEKNFGLSPSEFAAACASAPWSAVERCNTRDVLSEAMGTARFVLALTSCLSTASSWRGIWAGGSIAANTSTTETALKTIIELRTLKFSLLKITPESIMRAHSTGLWSIANASTAERLFDGIVRQLNGILEQRALGNVIALFADCSLDAGASPNWNPICLGRKPLTGTVATNVLEYGTGALNIVGTRVGTRTASTGEVVGENQAMAGPNYGRVDTGEITIGRWPANIVHDGSDEVVALFPDNDGQQARVTGNEPTANGFSGDVKFGGMRARVGGAEPRGDSGSAARFFYTAKADAGDRMASKHPTVKPVDLMQWLVRLITPPGGLVLEPFAGSGTTGEAAFREGMRCVMIEREAAFVTDIRRRIDLLLAGPEERNRAAIKVKIADGRIVDDAGPLFGGPDLAQAGRQAGRYTVTSETKTNDWPDRAQAVTHEH